MIFIEFLILPLVNILFSYPIMKFFSTVLFFYLFFVLLSTAQNYTISGYISDAKNGETLINASVIDLNSAKGSVGNSSGFYSLTLPQDSVRLRYSYVSYNPEFIDLYLTKDTIINIRLTANNILQEVTVSGQQNEYRVHGTQLGAVEVAVDQIKSIPTLLGEVDIFKALQLLPGVQGGMEGTSGVYVRGGGPDQNLILLDGVPLYNVDHALGLFSVFNADAIKNITLYKGNFPARFGGRLSSVIDLQTKDGDDKNYHGNINIGLVSAKINLEGPIIKEKTTFNISARRTYLDLFAQPVLRFIMREDENNANANLWLYFYDLNAKITHKFSNNDRLFFTFYTGDDAISTKLITNVYYGMDGSTQKDHTDIAWNRENFVSAIRWNHMITNKLFMNTTASFTRYRYNVSVGNVTKITDNTQITPAANVKSDYISKIDDYSAKVDLDYSPNPEHSIKMGANYTFHGFRPRILSLQAEFSDNVSGLPDSTLIFDIGDKDINTHETNFYVEDNFIINRFIKANAGLHYSAYFVQKRFYHSLQPRLNIRFLLNEHLSLKAGYAYMNQYIHLLSGSSIMLPTDLWVPATKRVKPLNSHQVSTGIFYELKNIADFSVEAYYKSLSNLVEYKDGASFIGSNAGWEDKIVSGRGWSYGIEFLVQRSFEKTTGWLGYTWSKSERLFDRAGEELNFGKVFPAKYDRRHDISITVSHKFNDKIDISGNWLFSTGHCGTLETQEYPAAVIPGADNHYDPPLNYISKRNNYRYENYHRLDFGINFHKQKRHGTRTWNISVYNMYNRLNPFIVYTRSTDYSMSSIERTESEKSFVKLSIFPLIPSVSYTFRF